MSSLHWAYSLLGILLAIIYIVDGWRSVPGESASIRQSPKVRGLLYLLGGVAASAVDAYLNPGQPSGVPIYIVAFTITTLIGLVLLTLYALGVSYRTIKQVFPHRERLAVFLDSLPYSFIALQQGVQRFKHEISSLRLRQIVEQRNFSIDFLLGFYGSLMTRKSTEDSVQTFLRFADKCLEAFLLNYLENGSVLENYRASIYFCSNEKSEFEFLTGVSPETAQHSKLPLPAGNSLAAWALRNPSRPHRFPNDNAEPGVPFHEREMSHRYNSVICCAVPTAPNNDNEPDMVLSIDSVESSIPELSDYVGRMTIAVSSLLSHTCYSMTITPEKVRD